MLACTWRQFTVNQIFTDVVEAVECKTTEHIQYVVWQRRAAVKEFVLRRKEGFRGEGGSSCETSTGG